MTQSNEKIQLVREPEDAAKARKTQKLNFLRLCQAMILIGEKITSQRAFLNQAKVSRSNAFNLIRGEVWQDGQWEDTRPPSTKTISKLAAFCMNESPVPWSAEVSRTIADSLLPALKNYSAWRDWRGKNLALVAFADSVAAPARCNLDQETIAGGAVVRWLVALGDYCDHSDQSATKYRETCSRLVTVLNRINTGGPFAQWVQFRALHDRYVLDWNSIAQDERGSPKTKELFEPFFKLLCDYIDAGNPTLIAEHMNMLAFASRFNMVETFGSLRDGLEQAWRRHNGSQARPDYMDKALFDSDFKLFRAWLQNPVERRRIPPDMPTTIPRPTDRGEFRFVAADADGHEWEWNDEKMVWVAVSEWANQEPSGHTT